MKVLFDTSVLVAALEVNHPRHSVCLPWLQQAQIQDIDGCMSTHTLAELYAVLTRLPIRPPITPAIAEQLIIENFASFAFIPLLEENYRQAIEQMVSLNLPGGGIFDALIAQSACKIQADVLLTLNPKHFTRLSDELAAKVRVP